MFYLSYFFKNVTLYVLSKLLFVEKKLCYIGVTVLFTVTLPTSDKVAVCVAFKT
jgi:hypothetical protein